MTQSDRAFHALAQNEPEVVWAALRIICPQVVAHATPIRTEDLQPTRLDALAPPLDADWLARVGARTLLHLECQGYLDGQFPDRLFRYHLLLTLQHPERTVHTVALWLTRPLGTHRRGRITRRRVTVPVTHIVLAEVPAAALLADPRTACFAPGADAGEMGDEALCDAVARALAMTGASWYQRHMAVVTAHTRGRDRIMTSAMNRAGVEPVLIIEDVVHIGEQREAVRSIFTVAEVRGLTLSDAQRERVRNTHERAPLRLWLERAATVTSADAIFATPPRRRKPRAPTAP
jgi:hypothetical protein